MTTSKVASQTAMLDTTAAMADFMTATVPNDAGAVVAFSGVVRNHDAGRSVVELEYEAHPSAGDLLQSLTAEVALRHPGVSMTRMAHRTGRLQIGDCALYAEVCAPHRAEAFAACADLVESVKASLPVWKRQVFDDGTDEWVNSP